MDLLAFITWNPPRIAFVIPYFNYPIAWSGILFAFGFFLGYVVMTKLLQGNLVTFFHRIKSPVSAIEKKTSDW